MRTSIIVDTSQRTQGPGYRESVGVAGETGWARRTEALRIDTDLIAEQDSGSAHPACSDEAFLLVEEGPPGDDEAIPHHRRHGIEMVPGSLREVDLVADHQNLRMERRGREQHEHQEIEGGLETGGLESHEDLLVSTSLEPYMS